MTNIIIILYSNYIIVKDLWREFIGFIRFMGFIRFIGFIITYTVDDEVIPLI